MQRQFKTLNLQFEWLVLSVFLDPEYKRYGATLNEIITHLSENRRNWNILQGREGDYRSRIAFTINRSLKPVGALLGSTKYTIGPNYDQTLRDLSESIRDRFDFDYQLDFSGKRAYDFALSDTGEEYCILTDDQLEALKSLFEVYSL